MENQINIGDQNMQQIGQNSIEQPTAVQKKPKINYWVVSTVSFVVILILVFIYFSLSKKQNSYLKVQKIAPTPVATSPQISVEPISIETIKLETSHIGDPTTELFFSEDNSVYSVKSDGLVKKLTKVDGNITALSFVPGKDDLFLETNYGPTVLEIDGKANNGNWWILRKNSQQPEKLTVDLSLFGGGSQSPGLLDIEEMTRFEKVYTKENDSGGAEILLDKLDGNQSTRIGFLKEKLLETACEFANCIKEKYHPRLFVSSFGGSFLLNARPRGGGLGEQGIVVSRDGSKTYKIDFYWYVSAAVWIDDNKLLAQDQKGAKIFTFNSNETVIKTDIPAGIGDQFNQQTLSPNKKYIGVITFNPNYEVSLFDTNTFEKRVVETVNPVTPGAIDVIGWNKDSTKMLYVVNDEAKIYSTNSEKTEVIASLKNGAPEWVRSDRPAFAKNIFEIR